MAEAGAWRAQCGVLASAPASTRALVWGQTGISFQKQFQAAGCGDLAAAIENRSVIIVSFEPLFSRATAAACPRAAPSSGGELYLAVPWPTQFHAASDHAISAHVAAIRRLARPHLVAYYAGVHGRAALLRQRLHEACRAAAPRCLDLEVPPLETS